MQRLVACSDVQQLRHLTRSSAARMIHMRYASTTHYDTRGPIFLFPTSFCNSNKLAELHNTVRQRPPLWQHDVPPLAVHFSIDDLQQCLQLCPTRAPGLCLQANCSFRPLTIGDWRFLAMDILGMTPTVVISGVLLNHRDSRSTIDHHTMYSTCRTVSSRL